MLYNWGILHLLPAASETLVSINWLSACGFCTEDVNNTKTHSLTETKACWRSGECEMYCSNSQRSCFLLLKQHYACIPCDDISMK